MLNNHCIKRQNSVKLPPAPLLVVEIVSPGVPSSKNYRCNYIEKPREYAVRGIPELWQIDPSRSLVIASELVNEGYQSRPFHGEDLIISPQFSNLQLTADQILRAGESS